MIKLKEWPSVLTAENELTRIMSEFLELDVINKILRQYRIVDSRHDSRHILDVVNHANEILRTFDQELEPHRKIIMIGAFMHDIGLVHGRKNHHLHSAQMVPQFLGRARDLTLGSSFFSRNNILLISGCIEQHRASLNIEKWNSPAAEAVAAADRGTFALDSIFQRRYFDTLTEKLDTGIAIDISQIRPYVDRTFGHLIDKFGFNGYAYRALPQYSVRMYKSNMDNTSTVLSNLGDKLKEEWIRHLIDTAEAKCKNGSGDTK